MNHLNGWSTNVDNYLKDVEEGRKVTGSKLFRPPYGKLNIGQYKRLKETEQIVFWDVISGDFDQIIEGKRVINNVIEHVRNGSIIVMHDSAKALNNLKSSLSEIIVQLSEKGYRFSTISAR
jgi:peptidoglycan/xylan/chitin deacetylase (PgdA/CDA1 family)